MQFPGDALAFFFTYALEGVGKLTQNLLILFNLIDFSVAVIHKAYVPRKVVEPCWVGSENAKWFHYDGNNLNQVGMAQRVKCDQSGVILRVAH